MNKAVLLPAMTLLMQQQYERETQNREPAQEKPKRPPWETAIMNIPKSIRKGKTWEEIREIKKQIWINQQLEGKLICQKCGKTKDINQEISEDVSEFLLTPKGIFCKDCIEAADETQ